VRMRRQNLKQNGQLFAWKFQFKWKLWAACLSLTSFRFPSNYLQEFPCYPTPQLPSPRSTDRFHIHLLFPAECRSLSFEKMVNQVPKHVAIIMDGNGRWARQRGWPRSRGHLEGAKAVKACVETCLELGVQYLTLYAFSTENWQRPKEEVDTLMGLLRKFLRDYTRDLAGRGIRLQAIGRLAELPEDCQKELREAITQTATNYKLTTILAVNYSGRTEIIDGIKRVVQEVKANRLDPNELTAEKFSQFLYTSSWPDPDLLIRTSGEMRISNFLLWQLSYTEMYVTGTLWPDFKREDLLEAVAEYGRRQRRYGGV
jgi:undecaprenyl diphosphate synthase